jgi:hypothetical protein
LTAAITLDHALALAGTLDDTPGLNTGRERFRRYLRENVNSPAGARDYAEAWARIPGTQHQRALQDLVVHVGQFLGFAVAHGTYQRERGREDFGGLWRSREQDFTVVVQTNPAAVFARTGGLVDAIEALIAARQIASWNHAVGLYVVPKDDLEARQLEASIVQERRTDQLRLISVSALLVLADLVSKFAVRHESVLDILRPLGTRADPIVDALGRVAISAGEVRRAAPSRGRSTRNPATPESELDAKSALSEPVKAGTSAPRRTRRRRDEPVKGSD